MPLLLQREDCFLRLIKLEDLSVVSLFLFLSRRVIKHLLAQFELLQGQNKVRPVDVNGNLWRFGQSGPHTRYRLDVLPLSLLSFSLFCPL